MSRVERIVLRSLLPPLVGWSALWVLFVVLERAHSSPADLFAAFFLGLIYSYATGLLPSVIYAVAMEVFARTAPTPHGLGTRVLAALPGLLIGGGPLILQGLMSTWQKPETLRFALFAGVGLLLWILMDHIADRRDTALTPPPSNP